jgi:hypothetical protein
MHYTPEVLKLKQVHFRHKRASEFSSQTTKLSNLHQFTVNENKHVNKQPLDNILQI